VRIYVLGFWRNKTVLDTAKMEKKQGRGVHVTGVSAAYTFKLNKNILSE
jgi:hypothetical protein